MTDLTSQGWRGQVALVSPGLLVLGWYLLAHTERAFWARLGHGTIAAVIVWVAAFLGSLLAIAAVGWIQGRSPADSTKWETAVVPGALLFAAVWVWWHDDVGDKVREVAACAEEQLRLDRRAPVGQAVIDCYTYREPDDYPYEDY
jgi:hypothetical protein